MTIKAVFFDVGQTILSPAPDGVAFCTAARQFGFELSSAEVLAQTPAMYRRYEQHYQADSSFWDDDARAKAVWLDAYGLLYQLLGLGDQADAAALWAFEFYFNPGAWSVYSDVDKTLVELSGRGLMLGLISNWDSSLRPIIEGLGMADRFETIIASTEVGLHKPDAAIFRLALDRLGVTAEEALHVGDHLQADVQGALGAGLHAVLLDRADRHPEFGAAPRLTGLDGLAELIDGM